MTDITTIKIKAGNGGDGAVSFLRLKWNPKGGPDGGNGGNGGSIYVQGSKNLNTLGELRYKRKFHAENGGNGEKRMKAGKNGSDIIIEVPLGTQINYNQHEHSYSIDVLENGRKYLLQSGGRGGIGNAFFKSSINQAPTQSVPGIKTEELEVELELKILADIGFVGMPNAGKSTLINLLTNTHANVADYPFTTLEPNLGVLKTNFDNFRELIIADIPGLIEGASDGKGLGAEFLRHVERSEIIIHLVAIPFENSDLDFSSEEVIKNYQIIRNEITTWNKEIANKPELIVINKLDLLDESLHQLFKEKVIAEFKEMGIDSNNIKFISTFDYNRVKLLGDEIIRFFIDNKNKTIKEEIQDTDEMPVIYLDINTLPNRRMVKYKELENEAYGLNDNKANY